MRYSITFVCLLFISQSLNGQKTSSERIGSGEKIYLKKCASCHGKDGLGKGDRIPPLASSDYLENNLEQSIRGILFGQKGEIRVNGVLYDKRMRAIKLTDQEVANVMNYIRNSWGNKDSEVVTAALVAQIRNKN